MRMTVALFIFIALRATAQPSTPVEVRAPEFPESAVKARMEGRVQVTVVIGTDGSVANASIFKGLNPLLDRVSLEAARAWRYSPEPGTSQRSTTLAFIFTVREDPPSERQCFVGPSQVTVVLPDTVRIQGWSRPPPLTRN